MSSTSSSKSNKGKKTVEVEQEQPICPKCRKVLIKDMKGVTSQEVIQAWAEHDQNLCHKPSGGSSNAEGKKQDKKGSKK